jgi:hypothetical protein
VAYTVESTQSVKDCLLGRHARVTGAGGRYPSDGYGRFSLLTLQVSILESRFNVDLRGSIPVEF